MAGKLVAMLVVGMLAIGGSVAYAGTYTYPTRFTEFKLERDSGKRTFSGQIGSTKSSCLKGRKVELSASTAAIRRFLARTQLAATESSRSCSRAVK